MKKKVTPQTLVGRAQQMQRELALEQKHGQGYRTKPVTRGEFRFRNATTLGAKNEPSPALSSFGFGED